IKIVSGQTRSGAKFGLDVNSPQFKSAMRACRSLDPNGGRPDPQVQAKEVERALAFARCMRSHGVPKFPDPKISADGGMRRVIGGSGVKPASPPFKAAERTCQKLAPSVDDSAPPASGQGGTP